jgi:hypothetical protein
MKRNTEYVAWAAGLFEGEGWIYLSNKDVRRTEIGVEMCDEDVVRRFYEVIGVGSVTVRRHTETQDVFSWRTSELWEVAHVLQTLRPFMGTRRGRKADEALERVRGRMK